MPGVCGSEDMEVDAQQRLDHNRILLESGRTLQDVDSVLEAAKIDKIEIQPVTQEIIFDTNFKSKEYRLLQLDKAVLERLETGQVLVFRGDEHDSAVLCTETETFEIKDAETSNSLVLFKDLQFPEIKSPAGSTSSSISNKSPNVSSSSLELNDSVINLEQEENDKPEDSFQLTVNSRMILEVAHSYLEMKRMRPNLSKIRFILAGTEYDGLVQDAESFPSVTFSTLLNRVPASEQEIRDYLHENRILEMDGKLRLVEDDYLFKIFSQVLNSVDGNSWNNREIDKDVVISELVGIAERFFVEKVFQWFLEPVNLDEPCASSAKIKYTYRQLPVCRFLGETLLKSMGKFNLKQFLKVWQESVPEGLTVNLNQLNGLAVFDEECCPPLIWHFPEYNLPELFTERMALLFETKRRWKLDEIQPFIEIFAPPGQNVGNLLTKYARSTTIGGVKYYSAKHGK